MGSCDVIGFYHISAVAYLFLRTQHLSSSLLIRYQVSYANIPQVLRFEISVIIRRQSLPVKDQWFYTHLPNEAEFGQQVTMLRLGIYENGRSRGIPLDDVITSDPESSST